MVSSPTRISKEGLGQRSDIVQQGQCSIVFAGSPALVNHIACLFLSQPRAELESVPLETSRKLHPRTSWATASEPSRRKSRDTDEVPRV